MTRSAAPRDAARRRREDHLRRIRNKRRTWSTSLPAASAFMFIKIAEHFCTQKFS